MTEVRFVAGPGTEIVGRFADGSSVRAERGRSRAYPGLAAEAPSTVPFYELACEELDGAKRVLDVGCGAGAGAGILAGAFEEVVGVDRDETAVQFARRFASSAVFAASDCVAYRGACAFDAAVVVDVLGHVESPFAVMRAVRSSLRPDAKILVAEASAYPTQSLHHSARRAFSPRSLKAVLCAAGFDILHWVTTDGPFIACVVTAVSDGPAEQLAGASSGVASALEALSLTEDAPVAVRLEAALSLADLQLSKGDGDGAGKAYFRARALDPCDPRPLAGLAQMSLAIGQLKDAVSLASMGLRLDSTDSIAAATYAMAVEATHPSEALAAWRIAANLTPDHPGVVARFVEVAVAQQDFTSALLSLEKLRGYGDELGASFHLLTASVLLAAGRRADAVLEARLAVAGAPNDPGVRAFWDHMNAA